MTFCSPQLVDGLPRCPVCGIDFPYGEYDLSKIRRPCRQPNGGNPGEPLKLWFSHGLGDAVMFTSCLRHFRHYWPGRRIELYVREGQHRIFGNLVDFCEPFPHEFVPGFRRVEFFDCYRSLPDMPSTKVEACLLQDFGLQPIRELSGYQVDVPADSREGAARISKVFDSPLALLHYQGHSVREAKDLTHRQAADVAKMLAEAGYVVLVCDFENQSPLPEQGLAIRLPRPADPRKAPDAADLAAIIERCALCVGVDSGPAHLAQALGVTTTVLWPGGLHPLHYFAPSLTTIHVLKDVRDYQQDVRQPQDAGLMFFGANYRYVVRPFYDLPLVGAKA